MSRVTTTRGYKGRGRFTLRPLSGGRPFELGNVVSLNESIEVDRSGRPNFQNESGGELDVQEVVTSYTFEAVADDITPENIAIGFRGTSTKIDSAAVEDELIDSWSGHRLALRYLPDPDETLTVALAATTAWAADTAFAVGDTILEGTRVLIATVGGVSGPTEPTWPEDLTTVTDNTVTWKDAGVAALVADTDYERSKHGIRMLAVTADRYSGDLPLPLEVNYTRNPQYLIQALVASGEEFEIIWHGLNSVDSGNPITSRYFRVKFSPTSGFGRHGGTDFGSMTLSGTVLADESREGEGMSAYNETAMI